MNRNSERSKAASDPTKKRNLGSETQSQSRPYMKEKKILKPKLSLYKRNPNSESSLHERKKDPKEAKICSYIKEIQIRSRLTRENKDLKAGVILTSKKKDPEAEICPYIKETQSQSHPTSKKKIQKKSNSVPI